MPGPRYALEDRVADGAGWALWRGADLVLRRPVGVLVVEAAHPHREAVGVVAVRAGSIRHPGAVHVYDVAETESGGLQVVREWVDARTLVDRLGPGPLAPAEACRIGAAVGRILGEAHRTGVAHGRLSPRDVLISDDGRVRVLGIGVSAALEGEPVDVDVERRAVDARDAAAVTYAAVTGRWAGHRQQPGLPNVRPNGGPAARARQVRAGVPASLDSTLARLLETATDADDSAEELEDVEVRLRDTYRADAVGPLGGLLGSGPPDAVAPRVASPDDRPQRGRFLTQVLAIGVSLAVLVATVVTATLLLHNTTHAATPGPSSSSTLGSRISVSPSPSAQSSSPSEPVGPLVIRGVKDFDPEGDGSEKPDEVGLAVDGDLSTSWQTLLYRQADLAPKHGVGLVLDLGATESIGAVRVDLVGTGTTLQIRTALTRGAEPSDYAALGEAKSAGHLVTLQAKAPTQARYILLWLTRLPPTGGGFRGGIAEVTVLRA